MFVGVTFPVLCFNPLPSCEGRPVFVGVTFPVLCFNPLPSCEGRQYQATSFCPFSCFNPLPSCEGRRNKTRYDKGRNCFNPLPSCEGRQVEVTSKPITISFNPLPSCEGRLCVDRHLEYAILASIHFPLAREDGANTIYVIRWNCFNPLPSCEGRRYFSAVIGNATMLQSTSLLRGKTSCSILLMSSCTASIHFPLAREDCILSVYLRIPD